MYLFAIFAIIFKYSSRQSFLTCDRESFSKYQNMESRFWFWPPQMTNWRNYNMIRRFMKNLLKSYAGNHCSLEFSPIFQKNSEKSHKIPWRETAWSCLMTNFDKFSSVLLFFFSWSKIEPLLLRIFRGLWEYLPRLLITYPQTLSFPSKPIGTGWKIHENSEKLSEFIPKKIVE